MPLVLSTNYKQSSRFGDWEMPIVPKNFRDTCYKMRTVCVSLYIYMDTKHLNDDYTSGCDVYGGAA